LRAEELGDEILDALEEAGNLDDFDETTEDVTFEIFY
jgi:hypothetical protein